MSKSLTFKLNRAGVRELMQSDQMVGVLESYAQKAAGSLGSGYEVTTMVGKNRANARIAAATSAARRDNLDNNTLLKAVGV